MTFNCCQKPFFSHKRAQSLSKNLFLPLSLRKTMLLRRDICKPFAVYLQRKPLTPRQTTPYKSQQNRLLPPDRVLIQNPQVQRKRTSYAATFTTQVEHKNNARSQQSGIQGRTARQPLADITLDGQNLTATATATTLSTRGKGLPFSRNQQKVLLCNLVVTHLLGWVWRCLFANTGQQSGELLQFVVLP